MDFSQLLSDPIGFIAGLLTGLLTGIGIPEPAARVVLMVIGVIVVASFCLVFPLFLIWFERRIVARMQDRMGPNRVGPQGLLQTIADALKLLTKEDITPIGADKIAYNIAPVLAVVAVISIWAVIPFAHNIVGTDVNVGALYIVSVGSLGTLAIMLGGWASNNKYALLGAFRTVAQLVSYEVPMILSLLVPVILARSMGMNDIVRAQEVWFIVSAPIAALIFFASSVAEVGRTPFDLLEAESEIVAGFHIEYSGMKFAMFFVAEFMHAFTVGALTAILFLGGWRGPFAEQYPILGVIYFMLKAFAGYFFVILLRATLPRIRIDHMLDLNWKFLTPVSLGAVVFTIVADKLIPLGAAPWFRAGVLFLANLLLGWITFWLLSGSARRMRQAEEGGEAGHGEEHGGQAEEHAPAHAPAH
ncbi:MAG TPA: NADH-quinone oxidoreductase subunit NuoH [Anaerolineales bacterium]|nr:NADH-quinone oxidoreductase subunit NuoH [Anaerolineales bacterium]